jgi:hypothetical protein
MLALCLVTACKDSESGSGSDAGDTAANGGGHGSMKVEGPITGGKGKPFTTSAVDLAKSDYLESEFLYSGDATAYAPEGSLTKDGKWKLNETTTKPFKTRMLVRRPKDAKSFSGTVIVEWLNVSGGADGDPGFMYNWQEILREGHVWVGVSAQQTGVEGGGFALLSTPPPPLKKYDPERYGSLSHPGDSYSFDIYTRAAQIVRGEGTVDVLGGLKAKHVIAYGESQSAMRLVSYVDGVQPITQAFDGFFIHSRGSSGVMFGDGNMLALGGPPAWIRDDLEQPVFQFQTETDVFGLIGFLPARQPDGDLLRTWEVPGTAHADAYILSTGAATAENLSDTGAMAPACENVNAGPQHFVLKAALHALVAWVVDGTAPVKGEIMKTDSAGKPMKDDLGNVLGGVRTPAVDVPISVLSGDPESGNSNILCSLFGHTTPFTAKQLADLYPTHDDYVTKVKASAQKTREAKFILEAEEQAMISEAEAAAVPK